MHRLTVSEAAALIQGGQLSPVTLVEAVLDRIDAVDGELRAWVTVDRDGALAAAREREAEVRAGRIRGAIHGIPVGVKDIFDVAGMVTTVGAAPFAHRMATEDAIALSRLRAAGAVVVGKTKTTEFAFLDPTDTRNPWNPRHTPGGSSSGSAAAVAARMVPLALGSQTIGSTLRPAGYCGVVGFKPAHGTIDRGGMAPLAPSLDHVGVFCRSVADVTLAFEVLSAGRSPSVEAAGNDSPPPLRLGVLRRLVASAGSEVADHLDAVASALRRAGAVIQDIDLPATYDGFYEAGIVVLQVEAAAAHAESFSAHGAEYQPNIRELVEAGMKVSPAEHARAQQHRRRFTEAMTGLLDGLDAVLAPVADTPAPEGLASTGNPEFCAAATFTGLPAIALPSGVAGNGLPLAIQLVSRWEARLLAVARWCEAELAFDAAP